MPRKKTKGLLVALLALAGLVVLWEEVFEDRLVPKRWGVVEEGAIYRSGQLPGGLLERMLTQNGIQVVVDLTGGAPGEPDQLAEREVLARRGIEHLQVPLAGDGTGDPQSYVEALAEIHRAVQEKKAVLVHCAAGSQRTGGAIAMYRLLVQRQTPDLVYKEMIRYDWDPEDDRILLQYINEHIAGIAQGLVSRGVLPDLPAPMPQLKNTF